MLTLTDRLSSSSWTDYVDGAQKASHGSHALVSLLLLSIIIIDSHSCCIGRINVYESLDHDISHFSLL